MDETQKDRGEVVSSDRIDRIEKVLEKVADKLEQLVALEVNHENTKEQLERTQRELVDVQKLLTQLDIKVHSAGMITSATERFGWMIVAAVVGIVAWGVKGMVA